MNYKDKYRDHKFRAKKRGLDFHFTYEEWIEWWGKDIVRRGNRKGNLVMSRYGDVGPYHPDNVFKNTAEQNASDGNKGRPKSEEHNAKVSNAKKGRPQSEEHKAKRIAAMKGIPKSEETKAKMSAARKGRPQSEEHKAKLVAARKAYYAKKKEITNDEN